MCPTFIRGPASNGGDPFPFGGLPPGEGVASFGRGDGPTGAGELSPIFYSPFPCKQAAVGPQGVWRSIRLPTDTAKAALSLNLSGVAVLAGGVEWCGRKHGALRAWGSGPGPPARRTACLGTRA